MRRPSAVSTIKGLISQRSPALHIYIHSETLFLHDYVPLSDPEDSKKVVPLASKQWQIRTEEALHQNLRGPPPPRS